MKYFSSDWHLSHDKVIGFSNRPFSSIRKMDETILRNMLSPLKKGDIFYFLGDLSLDRDITKRVLDSIPKGVTFVWILGNHDKVVTVNNNIEITRMKEIKIGKKCVTLCHYPMKLWNKSQHNSWQLFGHIHKGETFRQFPINGKMLNVNCEYHNYKPWTEMEITQYMENMPDNFDYLNRQKPKSGKETLTLEEICEKHQLYGVKTKENRVLLFFTRPSVFSLGSIYDDYSNPLEWHSHSASDALDVTNRVDLPIGFWKDSLYIPKKLRLNYRPYSYVDSMWLGEEWKVSRISKCGSTVFKSETSRIVGIKKVNGKMRIYTEHGVPEGYSMEDMLRLYVWDIDYSPFGLKNE